MNGPSFVPPRHRPSLPPWRCSPCLQLPTLYSRPPDFISKLSHVHLSSATFIAPPPSFIRLTKTRTHLCPHLIFHAFREYPINHLCKLKLIVHHHHHHQHGEYCLYLLTSNSTLPHTMPSFSIHLSLFRFMLDHICSFFQIIMSCKHTA